MTDRPRHPGELLAERLEAISRSRPRLTQAQIAHRMGVSRPRLSELLHCKRPVTLDTALRLERLLGTPAERWLAMQTRWDLHAARRERARARELLAIPPLADAPEDGAAPDADGAQAAASGAMLGVAPGSEREQQAERTALLEQFLAERGLLGEARRFARAGRLRRQIEEVAGTAPRDDVSGGAAARSPMPSIPSFAARGDDA